MQIDALVKMARNAEAVEEALSRPWFERGFIIDDEALGGADLEGVLSVAGPTTLKMVREAHLVRAISMRKKPRGWIRTWPVEDIIRAEVASQFAHAWGISIKSAVTVLQSSSRTVPIQPGDEIAPNDEEHTDTTGAVTVTKVPDWLRDPVTKYAQNLLEAANKKPDTPIEFGAHENTNITLSLIDRRWLYLRGVKLPDGTMAEEDTLIAHVQALKTLDTKLRVLFTTDEDYLSNQMRTLIEEAHTTQTRPMSVLTFDVTETLRRFTQRLLSQREVQA